MAGLKVKVALDAEPEGQPHALKFGGREAAEFGTAEPQVRKTEQDAVGIDLGCEPGGGADGAEEAHDGLGIGLARAARDRVVPRGSIGDRKRTRLNYSH